MDGCGALIGMSVESEVWGCSSATVAYQKWSFWGNYDCTAPEKGYREVVLSYLALPSFSARCGSTSYDLWAVDSMFRIFRKIWSTEHGQQAGDHHR